MKTVYDGSGMDGAVVVTDNARTPPAPLPSDEALNEAELAALGEDVDIEADARRISP